MAKYLYLGSYTQETWSKLVENPEDRTAAVQKLAEAVGGRLDSIYWAFGPDDFVVIAEAPDDTAAAAVSLAVGASGAIDHIRTVKLISMDEGQAVLRKAKQAAGVYQKPGTAAARV